MADELKVGGSSSNREARGFGGDKITPGIGRPLLLGMV